MDRSKEILSAVTSVLQALAPLSNEERERVLHSAGALYGIAANVSAPSGGTAGPKGTGGVSGGNQERKKMSIVEFLRETSPQTNAQKIATFAYYREHMEGHPHFSRDDLKGYFASAKEAAPGNFDRDFAKAVQAGWIHEEGGNSYLTNSGSTAVENKFPQGSRIKSSTKKPAASPGTATEE